MRHRFWVFPWLSTGFILLGATVSDLRSQSNSSPKTDSSISPFVSPLSLTYSREFEAQGDKKIRKAREYFLDGYWEPCIQELQEFQLLYGSHPKRMEAWQLLSQVYQKKRDFGRAAEAELAIYREFPDREEGYESLLSAARCYVKMGDYSRAKNLLVEITENSFFPRVNKQANIELAQIQFLTEKPEEILEN